MPFARTFPLDASVIFAGELIGDDVAFYEALIDLLILQRAIRVPVVGFYKRKGKGVAMCRRQRMDWIYRCETRTDENATPSLFIVQIAPNPSFLGGYKSSRSIRSRMPSRTHR